jgi:hypothetical protein
MILKASFYENLHDSTTMSAVARSGAEGAQ